MILAFSKKTPASSSEFDLVSAEAAGSLVRLALQKKETPHAVRANPQRLDKFQRFIRGQRVETEWTAG